MHAYRSQMRGRRSFFGAPCRFLASAVLVVVLGGCAGVQPRGQTDLPYPNYRVEARVGVVIDPALGAYERRQPPFEVFERSGTWARDREVRSGTGPTFQLGEGLVETLKAAAQESFAGVTFLDAVPQGAPADPSAPAAYLVLSLDPATDIQIQIVEDKIASGFLRQTPFDGTKVAVRVRAEVRGADGRMLWSGTVRGKGFGRGPGRHREACERAFRDVALRLRQALVTVPEIAALAQTAQVEGGSGQEAGGSGQEAGGSGQEAGGSGQEAEGSEQEEARRLSVKAVNEAMADGAAAVAHRGSPLTGIPMDDTGRGYDTARSGAAGSVEAIIGERRFGEERLGTTRGIVLTPQQQIALYVADQTGATVEPNLIKVLTLREWNRLLVLATVYGETLTFADQVVVRLEQEGRAVEPEMVDRPGFAVPTAQYPEAPAYRSVVVAGFPPEAVDWGRAVEVVVEREGAPTERWPLRHEEMDER